ncbi:MAG: GDP-mannose 4,6-dehydratase [Vicinamibacterales bacterium]
MADRVLVTGASGFAGSHLVERLAGQDVHAWTHSTAPPVLAEPVSWSRVDLMDIDGVRQVVAAVRPTLVYHCAGSPHVASSWHHSAEPLAQNVIGTHHLLDALRRVGGPCRVLITGSATVYASSTLAITERHTVAPVSPYAMSKFAQERLGLRAIAEDGLDVVVTRSFNHTGPRQAPAFVAPSMAQQVALIERGNHEAVLRVGNLEARRDFTDVRDVVAAYVGLAASGETGQIYNVASGVAPSMREILDALLARASVRIRVEPDPSRMRPHDMPVLLGDASKLRAATGWAPAISFEQMIDDLLEYWRKRVADSGQ